MDFLTHERREDMSNIFQKLGVVFSDAGKWIVEAVESL